MKIFGRIFHVYLYKIVLASLVIGACFTGYLSFIVDDKWGAICGGVCAGLAVAFVQMLVQVSEHNDLERIRRLGIREILAHRDGKHYYESLINKAEKNIFVLGVTASRFLDDFAHRDREDSRALWRAMQLKRITVRLLLPKTSFLEEKDQGRAPNAYLRIQELKQEFPGIFDARFFAKAPSHSIVCADDECLVGPVFPNVSSKDCPAIHVDATSDFAHHYLKFFEDEWKNAESTP